MYIRGPDLQCRRGWEPKDQSTQIQIRTYGQSDNWGQNRTMEKYFLISVFVFFCNRLSLPCIARGTKEPIAIYSYRQVVNEVLFKLKIKLKFALDF